jgi:hypothetical protein
MSGIDLTPRAIYARSQRVSRFGIIPNRANQHLSAFPSPVAAARRRLRLSRSEAARRLAISPGHLRLVDSGTRRIASGVMDNILALWEVPEADGTATAGLPASIESGADADHS